MTLTMTPLDIDIWKNEPPDRVDLICLLPNGILLQLKMPTTATIREIKLVSETDIYF